MRGRGFVGLTLLVGAGLLAACTRSPEPPTSTIPVATTVAQEDPHFYLNLMWHQHQPRYPLLADGTVSRPWVRVHATKDYYDMAALVAEYPNVSVTFNLTPILLLQLEELMEGRRDVYWELTQIPAEELSDDQIAFITARFFDVNPGVIARFPRFQELADQRGQEDFSTDDLRDLQVLFNLAWTDPTFLDIEPLAALVEKGAGFSEDDKATVLSEHERILSGVIDLHARLWEEGQIEVTTTPLAHPILPLIADTNLATVGDPAALLPENRLREVADAEEHIVRGLDTAERLLGRRPAGMWPGEGSVADLVMWLFSKNGVRWVASGEEVAAKSLGIDSFNRDETDLIDHPDLLYRPWSAEVTNRDPVAMFFRDGLLSDLIGFEYSGTEAGAAADDLMNRLRAIRDSLEVEQAFAAGHPYVVSIILDGENAWEHYPNDGIDFLSAFYERLSEADWISTITPSEYLDRFGAPEALPGNVWPGAWFQPNFATWIGEEEEATAWDYLFQVRDDLAAAEGNPGYDAAFTQMLFAEGSDWFWWYGSDQESGDDGYFDLAYRDLLGTVYDELGVARPDFLSVPIIPEQPLVPDSSAEGSASYGDTFPGGFTFSVDRTALTLFVGVNSPFEVYLSGGDGDRIARASGGQVLGFGATRVVRWDGDGAVICNAADECVEVEATGGDGTTIVVPIEQLGPLQSGDQILAKVLEGDRLVPEGGPMALQVPDISNVLVFLDVVDPHGDDHGPGTYTYPSDGVFTEGSYDLERFSVGTEGEDLVLTFDVVAPIQNPWGSPRNLSVQTFDAYIDTDPGTDNGEPRLIDGRNASLVGDAGWEFGITVEGWEPAIYVAGAEGTVEETRPSFDILVFGNDGRVVVRVPLSLLGGGDPSTWGYSAVVMSQEGFPSTGVRRVRDVETSAQQFRLGGAPNDANHTRIIDVASATEGEQEQLLSSYESSPTIEGLSSADFGRVPVLVVS